MFVPLLERYDNGSEHDAHRIAAYRNMNLMYDVILNSGLFLTPEAFKTLDTTTDKFLLRYNWLSRYAIDRPQFLYNETYETHALWHLVQNAKFLNPRASWAYGFENFMGKTKETASACTRGSQYNAIGRKVMERTIRWP